MKNLRKTKTIRNKSCSWFHYSQRIANDFFQCNYSKLETFRIMQRILIHSVFNNSIESPDIISEIEYQPLNENNAIDLETINLENFPVLTDEEIKSVALTDEEFAELQQEAQEEIENVLNQLQPTCVHSRPARTRTIKNNRHAD